MAEKQENTKSVARSTATMSLCTLASRATGFIRTWAMAFALGNTIMAAGFSLANNLPNMIYELVAGGVLSTAFLPIYLQQRNRRSQEAANDYASNLLSIAVVILGVIALIASIFAPQVMVTQSLFSSAADQTVERAVWFFRFFAFQIIFYGLSAIFSGLLNAEREFFWPAICSVFMNVISIIAFIGYPFISAVNETAAMTWLATGVTLSIAVMAFVQIPALRKTGIKLRPYITFKGEGLRETVRLATPAIASTAINLVALSFMNSCALWVADNGPASVSYAWMWYQFPYGVLGVALSTAMFTEMSECTSRRDWEGFKTNMRQGLKMTWMLIIPMAAMVLVCADQLIGLYAAGKFTANDIEPVASLLRGWAFNLPLYAGYMFLFMAYSSMKDMKTVAWVNFVLTFFQVGLYLLFTGVIIPSFTFGLVGIAVADIFVYLARVIVLLYILRRRMDNLQLRELVAPTVKVFIATVVGACAAWGFGSALTLVVNMQNMGGAFVGLIFTGIVGLGVIYVGCRILHIEEIDNFANSILRRLRRS